MSIMGNPDIKFFERNIEQGTEIIEGLLREGQLAVLGGAFGVGKSPLIADLTIHLLNGIPWCGREVQQRPVIVFDFENGVSIYQRNLQNICSALKVELPKVPDELDVYLEQDSPDQSATKRLLEVVSLPSRMKLEFIRGALKEKPNALVIIDPLEMLFRIDTLKKADVLKLYTDLRLLLSEFPEAANLMTFNLRKKDRRGERANLFLDPRGWLEEISGSLDIMNRSDVRLGMDFHNDDIRVINGIRRGEEMHPLLVKPVGDPDKLAGFELSQADEMDLKLVFTTKQQKHWEKLPEKFRFEAMADKVVPRASLSRIIRLAKSLGAIEQQDGNWKKVKL